jgi:hypothetical protein
VWGFTVGHQEEQERALASVHQIHISAIFEKQVHHFPLSEANGEGKTRFTLFSESVLQMRERNCTDIEFRAFVDLSIGNLLFHRLEIVSFDCCKERREVLHIGAQTAHE